MHERDPIFRERLTALLTALDRTCVTAARRSENQVISIGATAH